MITCMSQVGERYEDYSSLTSEKFVSSLKEHVETLVICRSYYKLMLFIVSDVILFVINY